MRVNRQNCRNCPKRAKTGINRRFRRISDPITLGFGPITSGFWGITSGFWGITSGFRGITSGYFAPQIQLKALKTRGRIFHFWPFPDTNPGGSPDIVNCVNCGILDPQFRKQAFSDTNLSCELPNRRIAEIFVIFLTPQIIFPIYRRFNNSPRVLGRPGKAAQDPPKDPRTAPEDHPPDRQIHPSKKAGKGLRLSLKGGPRARW